MQALFRRLPHVDPATQVLGQVLLALLILALTAPPAQAATTSERIVDFAFTDTTLSINIGDTVAWQNTGAQSHTVTSEVGVFDSGSISPGSDFSTVFNSAGTYYYYCKIHPQMRAAIVVGSGTPAYGNGTTTPTTASNQSGGYGMSSYGNSGAAGYGGYGMAGYGGYAMAGYGGYGSACRCMPYYGGYSYAAYPVRYVARPVYVHFQRVPYYTMPFRRY